MSSTLSALCELTGWADTDSLRSRVDRAAPSLARDLGLEADPKRWVLDPRFLPQLAAHCVVPETYFFRHAEQLEANARAVLQQFPEGPLQVWSAGCSTGEELYSLTMALVSAGASPGRIEALGTDLAPGPLAHARAARYGPWSFRGVSAELRQRFFTGDAAEWLTVAERYRQPVAFVQHNLAVQAPPLAQAHLVSCRNVLIYFRPEAALAALGRLVSVLAPGGLLLLGTAEQHLGARVGLEPLTAGPLVLLRKPLGGRPSAEPGPPHPPTSAPTRTEPSPPAPPAPLTDAWHALQRGDAAAARALAEPLAARDAEAQFVLATLAEDAGDLPGAVEHLRRALYLDPRQVVAHVAQARLYARLGRERDSARARLNALRHLKEVAPETVLRAAAPVTAAELRASLEVE